MQGNPCYARLFADLTRMSPNPIKASGGCGPRTPGGFSTGCFVVFTKKMVRVFRQPNHKAQNKNRIAKGKAALFTQGKHIQEGTGTCKKACVTVAFLLLHSCGRQGEYPREIGAENPLPIIHPPASLALTHTGAVSFCQTRGKGPPLWTVLCNTALHRWEMVYGSGDPAGFCGHSL